MCADVRLEPASYYCECCGLPICKKKSPGIGYYCSRCLPHFDIGQGWDPGTGEQAAAECEHEHMRAAYLRTVEANGEADALYAAMDADQHATGAGSGRPVLPPWCGKCGWPAGMAESAYQDNIKFRYLTWDVPCPTCHPDHPNRKGSTP